MCVVFSILTLRGDPEAPFLLGVGVLHFVIKELIKRIPSIIEYVMFFMAMVVIPLTTELILIDFPDRPATPET